MPRLVLGTTEMPTETRAVDRQPVQHTVAERLLGHADAEVEGEAPTVDTATWSGGPLGLGLLERHLLIERAVRVRAREVDTGRGGLGAEPVECGCGGRMEAMPADPDPFEKRVGQQPVAVLGHVEGDAHPFLVQGASALAGLALEIGLVGLVELEERGLVEVDPDPLGFGCGRIVDRHVPTR